MTIYHFKPEGRRKQFMPMEMHKLLHELKRDGIAHRQGFCWKEDRYYVIVW